MSTRYYRPDLDGVRFLAFLLVFFHHALPETAAQYVSSGLTPALAKYVSGCVHSARAGVDLFFVLSSFLITELLLREWDVRGTFGVKAFYARRMLRIWPLYFCFLAIAAALPFVWQDQQFSYKYLLPMLAFSGNWAFVAWGTMGSVADPLWSVSIEEQFYIVWPVVLLLRRGRALGAGLVIIGIAVCCRACFVRAGYGDNVLWYGSLTRLDTIGAGIVLAAVMRAIKPIFAQSARVSVFILSVATMLASFLAIGAPQVEFGLVTLGSSGALFAVLSGPPLAPLAVPSFAYLGRISYGLYVFHILALRLAHKIVPLRGSVGLVVHVALGLALTCAFAAISYRLLEMPFLRLKHRFEFVRKAGAL